MKQKKKKNLSCFDSVVLCILFLCGWETCKIFHVSNNMFFFSTMKNAEIRKDNSLLRYSRNLNFSLRDFQYSCVLLIRAVVSHVISMCDARKTGKKCCGNIFLTAVAIFQWLIQWPFEYQNIQNRFGSILSIRTGSSYIKIAIKFWLFL